MNVALRACLLAVASLGTAVPVWADKPDEKAKVKIEFRRAETKPADGLKAVTVPGSDAKIYIVGTADATNEDVADARAGMDAGGNPTVEIVFTKAGAKKMAELTGKHIDKPLAVLINGAVVCAPVVRAKLSDTAQLNGSFTKEEAEKIAKGIMGK